MIQQENKKTVKTIYESSIAILALCVAVILILQSTLELSENTLSILNVIDNLIWVIFIIDYIVRLMISENKKIFIKSNIIDLISILPFSSMLKVTRLLRIVKLAKLLRFLRLVAVLGKFKNKINIFVKTNNFNYVLLLTLCTIMFGAVGMYLTEDKPFLDSIWWSFVTTTTVGYGDISPVTPLGRLIAAILMIVGIGFLGMLTGTIATFFIDKKDQTSYKNSAIEDIKEKLNNFDTLSAEEVNDICKVLRALKE